LKTTSFKKSKWEKGSNLHNTDNVGNASVDCIVTTSSFILQLK
jgi:hypothetical protein